jgi:hypothetical protein
VYVQASGLPLKFESAIGVMYVLLTLHANGWEDMMFV